MDTCTLMPPGEGTGEKGIDGEVVRVAGRVMRWSDSGKLRFGTIQDLHGRIQVMISKKDIAEDQWELWSASRRVTCWGSMELCAAPIRATFLFFDEAACPG